MLLKVVLSFVYVLIGLGCHFLGGTSMRSDYGVVLDEGPTGWVSASVGLIKNLGCMSRTGRGMC